jgi:DNA-binding transcriptional ArsR family regulator
VKSPEVRYSKVLKTFIKGSFVLIGLFGVFSYGIDALLIHSGNNTTQFNVIIFLFLLFLLIIFCHYAKAYYDESKIILSNELKELSDKKIKELEKELKELKEEFRKLKNDQKTKNEETRFKVIDKLNELFKSVIGTVDPSSDNTVLVNALQGISDKILGKLSEIMSGK